MNAPAADPAEKALERAFRIEGLTIDPRDGEASGPGGREKLDPKVMDVLLVLARNAGQVVLREDLLARLWPNAVVTDESLSRCIYELRRQLSLAGGDDRYRVMFETVPKRGYRLNAQVTPIAPEVIEPSRAVAGASGAVAVACRRDLRRDRRRDGGLVHARPPRGRAVAATRHRAILAGRAAFRRPEPANRTRRTSRTESPRRSSTS